MSDEETAVTVAELRRRMEAGWQAFAGAIDALSPDQLDGPQDAARWTVQDHMAHLAAWADGIAALLRGEPRWAAMGLAISAAEREGLDYDALNEQIAARHRSKSAAEVRAWLAAAHRRVADAVAAMSDADLLRPYGSFLSPPDAAGDPIFGYVAGNTYEHYAEHLPWIQAIAEQIAEPPWPIPSVAEVHERMVAEHAALTALIADLSDAQLAARPADGGWSIKDHLAHLAAWELGIAALLRGDPRFTVMGLSATPSALGGIEAANRALQAHNADRTAPEVRAMLAEAHRQALAAIGALSDADLHRPYRHYAPAEARDDAHQPVAYWVAGDTYVHYADHRHTIEALLQ